MCPRLTSLWTCGVLLFLLFSVLSPSLVRGKNYIPGAQARYYAMGEPVSLSVNSLRSASYTYPLDYYALPVCQPPKITYKTESLGEIIWGDRLANSLYVAHMLTDRLYHITENCGDEIVNKALYGEGGKDEGLDFLNRTINRGYRGFMNIDNLPLFFDGKTLEQIPKCTNTKSKAQEQLSKTVYGSLRGYPLGVPSYCTGDTMVYNHLNLKIFYNTENGKKEYKEGEKYMVVGLKVIPYSIKWTSVMLDEQLKKEESEENAHFNYTALKAPQLFIDADMKIGRSPVYWTYNVEWHASDVLWSSRWDEYFRSSVAGSVSSLHYTYACTSVTIVLLAASIAASVLMRALHKDFNRYNAEDPEDLQEETGWKLIHADVFRPPNRAASLATLAGNGYQILGMCGGVFVLAILGFLSPSRRGALATALLVLFVVMSIISGYVCGFFLTYFGQRSWRPVLLCGCAFPGAVCGTYLFFNIVDRALGSTAAAPFTTILLLFALWIFASVPLTVLGASAAFGQGRPEDPVRVGRLAREIPKQVGLNSRTFLFLVPPLFPLATIITELYFVMQGLWAGAVFYAFGFLTFVSILWAVVCALAAVSQVYYVLCYENHRWWWYAFMIPGCMGLHMFGFAVVFFFTQLQITTFASALLYFSYMGLISFGYGVAAGAIGLTACLAFVRAIYRNIKVD